MNLGGKPDRRPITETKKFYIFGLVGEHTVIAKDYCSNGVSRIKEEFTIGDIILTTLTVGIYAPRTVNIYCKI
jgi:hypothetical protein